MQKSKLMVLIASAVLIAAITVAGCTDSSTSDQTGSVPVQTAGQAAKAVETAPAGNAGSIATSGTPVPGAGGDGPQFNQSAGPMGTPPEGMEMNGTHPSSTPPAGMEMNGTRPSGTPPGGMMMNGTRPQGTPPSGAPPTGS